MIEVSELSKAFDRTLAVDDISFNIDPGEVVGLLGPNGAGKTTTMRLLTHYLTADSGSIRIAGIDIEEDPLSAREKIGYLPESSPLYNDLSVLEYLVYVSAIRRIPKNRRRDRIKEMVHVCGLEEVLGRNVGVLSKGYRQRVGLAQTLIHDPIILILDEPTTGLDPNQIVEIRELIKKVGKEKTIIISTHILPEVKATCGRVLIINEGKIVADGTPSSLAEQRLGGVQYRITTKGETARVEESLHTAPFIHGFEKMEQDEGGAGYLIRGASEEFDLGEALFKLAVDRGFILTEIRREGVSLENIFADLTRGEEGS